MENEKDGKIRAWFSEIRLKAKKIKRDISALYLACKRPDTPLYAKLFSILVVGYALSPIDLIPDFIPVLGYLDDIILLPLGITLAIKLIPENIIKECREESENLFKNGKPKNWTAGVIIICIWILIIGYILSKIFLKF